MAILSPAAVWDEVRRGELVLAPIKTPMKRRTIYLVKNLTRATREVERSACEIARELVKRDQGMGQLISRD